MDPITLATIGLAAGSAVGQIGSDIGSYFANRDLMQRQNAFNAEQAQIARDFEREMSNTAYTRAVQDMRNAGLNPALMYSQGGASTPSASPATAVGAGGLNFGNPMKGVLTHLQPGVDPVSNFHVATDRYFRLLDHGENTYYQGERLSKNPVMRSALNQAERDYFKALGLYKRFNR